jgi:signal transduction histidine kinase
LIRQEVALFHVEQLWYVGPVKYPGRLSEREESDRTRWEIETVGRLADSLAHEILNIATIIAGHVEIIAEVAAKEIIRSKAGKVLASIDRLSRLAEQLLAVSRPAPPQTLPADLNSIIDNADVLLRNAIGGSYVLRFDQAPLPPVKVDPNAFTSAMLNLLMNAREAVPPGCSIRVVTAPVRLDDGRADELGLKPGLYAMAAVMDDGPGMSPETLARAGRPWFTTKNRNTHPGFGIFQVRGFAEAAGGRFEIASEQGMGTAARIFLPAIGDNEKARPREGDRAKDREEQP